MFLLSLGCLGGLRLNAHHYAPNSESLTCLVEKTPMSLGRIADCSLQERLRENLQDILTLHGCQS